MAGITLAQAEAQLASWLAASTTVASGQTYSFTSAGVSRTLSNSNAEEIRKQIMFWNRQVKRLTAGGISIRGVTPV